MGWLQQGWLAQKTVIGEELNVGTVCQTIADGYETLTAMTAQYFHSTEARQNMKAAMPELYKLWIEMLGRVGDSLWDLQRDMEKSESVQKAMDAAAQKQFGWKVAKGDPGRYYMIAAAKEARTALGYIMANGSLKGYDSAYRFQQLYGAAVHDAKQSGELDGLDFVVTTAMVVTGIVAIASIVVVANITATFRHISDNKLKELKAIAKKAKDTEAAFLKLKQEQTKQLELIKDAPPEQQAELAKLVLKSGAASEGQFVKLVGEAGLPAILEQKIKQAEQESIAGSFGRLVEKIGMWAVIGAVGYVGVKYAAPRFLGQK